jgi:hypothetical protein
MSPGEKTYEVRYSDALRIEEGMELSDFRFPWKEDPAPETRFRAVWNEEFFAFSFEVEDHDLVIPDAEDPGEGALASDRVELFFSPSEDLRPVYYGAEMDPRGRVYDYRASFHRQFDPEWSFETLRFSGDVRENGYRVEGTVAISELRDLNCLQAGEMIAGVYRAEFSHGVEDIQQDWISWISPDAPTPDFHIPSSFGRFLFRNK